MHLISAWFKRQFSNPQVVILIAILLTGFLIIFGFGSMLLPFFASIVIAYILDGIVRSIARRGVPRIGAVIAVFLFFMFALVFSLVWLVPLLIKQVTQLFQQLPSMIAETQSLLLQLPERYPKLVSTEQINEILAGVRQELTSWGHKVLTTSVSSVVGLITIIVYLILVPLLVFFFLKDKDKIIQWFTGFLPKERPLVTHVWNDVNLQIGNYIRGKTIEILIVWAVSYTVFSLLGLQYAILLSMVVGISVIIPYIGAAVATIPVLMVAYFQWGFTPPFLWVLIAYLIIQALDGNVLVPLLFSEVVNIHPVATIASILVFGGLWGFWGVFFAIPLATLIQAILKAWPRQSQVEEMQEKPAS